MKNLNNQVRQDKIVPHVKDLEIDYQVDRYKKIKKVKIIEYVKRFIPSNFFTYSVC